VADIAPIGDRAGKSEEHQISSRYECGRQPGLSDPNLCLTGERRFRNLSKRIDAHNVVFTEPLAPILPVCRQSGTNARTHFEFNGVTLTVSKPDRLHPSKALERPGKTDS
jgi:hypothetical protein